MMTKTRWFSPRDDRTDEDMFEVLQDKGVTLKIGRDPKTKAQFFLEDQANIQRVLERLFL